MVSDGKNEQISERIQVLLEGLGISATAASVRAGMSRDGIRNILRNPKSIPRGKTLLALAAALKTTPDFILSGRTDKADNQPEGLLYGGVVEAGNYRAVELLDQDSDNRLIEIPRDPRFARAKQYAFLIIGDSMTEANLYENMWAVAVAYHDYVELYGDVRDGTNVIVSRARPNTPEVELSIKELRIFRDRTELHPRSKNPKHQNQVYKLSASDDSDVEIRIVAVVVSAVSMMKF